MEKGTAKLFRVANEGEFATVCIDSAVTISKSGRQVFSGEILIRSSFGNLGYYWNDCGIPFEQFLVKLEMSYFMQKCMDDLYVYCPERSLANVQAHLRELVADDTFTEEEAARISEELAWFSGSIQASPNEFLAAMTEMADTLADIPNIEFLTENASEYLAQTYHPQAIGFWKKLWPGIVSAVNQAAAPQAQAA